MQIFARAEYTASVPLGWTPPAIFGPVTGTGPDGGRASWRLAAMLAIAGAMVVGGGLVVRRT